MNNPYKGRLLFFFGGVRKVQEDNNGKLNPSHFVGPSRDYITLNVPPRAFSNVPLQIW